MSVSYKVIGRHIRDARRASNMTQEDLADKLEMSSAHLGKIERGERAVNLERLSQICLLLGVALETLIAGALIGAQLQVPESDTAFLSAITELSQGCSERSRKLMLRLCREVSENEKD